MKQNTKILILAIIIITVIVLIYLIYKYYQKKNLIPIDNTNTNTSGGGYTDTVDKSKILKLNDASNSVIELQKVINAKLTFNNSNTTKLVLDGVFGPLTNSALKEVTNNTISSELNNASINFVTNYTTLILRNNNVIRLKRY